MNTEKRIHPRFNPADIKVSITLNSPTAKKAFILHGTIIDMSYTGIKIKLNQAITDDLTENSIKISFTLPESGTPVSIYGMIKHYNENAECGLQFSENHPEHKVDDLMFECIKIASKNIQRIITPSDTASNL